MVTTKRENIIDPALFSDMNKRIEDAKESVEQNVEWVDGLSGEFVFDDADGNNLFKSMIKSLIIPEGYTSIGVAAFQDMSNIEKIVLPEGITTIRPASFTGCSGISSIRIPSTVSLVAQGAFAKCTKLQKVEIAASASTISGLHKTAFDNCTLLTDIYVPWSEGEVADAPWGATNATIHYNWKE